MACSCRWISCFMPWDQQFQVMKLPVSHRKTKCFKRMKQTVHKLETDFPLWRSQSKPYGIQLIHPYLLSRSACYSRQYYASYQTQIHHLSCISTRQISIQLTINQLLSTYYRYNCRVRVKITLTLQSQLPSPFVTSMNKGFQVIRWGCDSKISQTRMWYIPAQVAKDSVPKHRN